MIYVYEEQTRTVRGDVKETFFLVSEQPLGIETPPTRWGEQTTHQSFRAATDYILGRQPEAAAGYISSFDAMHHGCIAAYYYFDPDLRYHC